jgi:uncharacterized protein
MARHFNHLIDCREQTDLLVSRIVAVVRTAKIFCFGIRRREFHSWSCFLERREKEPEFSFDLLVVTTVEERRQRFEVLDAIETALAETRIATSVCVHSVEAVCQAIADGSMFFSTVCSSGMVLYQDTLGSEACEVDCAMFNDVHDRGGDWMRSYRLAGDFLRGALHFCSLGAGSIAVFMLHQAVEHTCIALSRLVMGYRPSTHNLRRLLAMTGNFTDIGCSKFPCNTAEEAALFFALSRAYSDVRYKEGFDVTEVNARILAERVRGFYEEAGKIYVEMAGSCSPSRFLSQNIRAYEFKQNG